MKRDEIKESLPALIPSPVAHRLLFPRPVPSGSSSSIHCGWEHADMSRCLEVHLRFIALLHGEQLRDVQVSASARSPSCCIPHLSPECFLLVSPSSAVADVMLPRLGYLASSTTRPPALVVTSVSEPFQVCPHRSVSGLQSVEPGCLRLPTVRWDGSLASRIALQSLAVVLTAFVGLPLSLRHRLCF